MKVAAVLRLQVERGEPCGCAHDCITGQKISYCSNEEIHWAQCPGALNPGCPLKEGEKSRSVLRREAIQRGEPMPQFPAKPDELAEAVRLLYWQELNRNYYDNDNAPRCCTFCGEEYAGNEDGDLTQHKPDCIIKSALRHERGE
jgi:hypothetical protein